MSEPTAPSRGDVLIAAITGAVSVAALLAVPVLSEVDGAEPVELAEPGTWPWWLLLAALVGQAVALAWIRRRPTAMVLTVAAIPVLVAVLASAGTTGLFTLASVVAVYRATLVRPRLRGELVATGVLIALATLLSGELSAALLLLALGQGAVVVLIGWLPALVVGSRRALWAAQANELRALAREQDALVQTAVATERTAMARELHDIAAHHLSGIALMASAIDRQIDTDPAAARQGVREVREQSRVVLADLRRLVGLLRQDEAAETSALSLAAVPELAERAGARIELPRAEPAIGPLAQLVVYRMVQESLTNARAHAPGADCVVLLDDADPTALVVTVRNGPPTTDAVPVAGGGHGLRGMAERAALVGAALRHGPTVAGGWEVRLVVPIEGETP